jgi:pimeloyl-ACP methyl ester carboxylesterase
MLLLHGVGMNGDYWSNLVPELSQHFRLTLIDLPGHGSSAPLPQEKPALQDFTNAIAEQMTSTAIVIGHSMGALIALDMAVRYPGKVNGIAVLNGIYRRSTKAQQAILQRVVQLEQARACEPGPTLERWFGKSPTGIEARACEQCRSWLEAVQPQHYIAAYRAFATADAPADNELKALQCPTLFITGAQEPNSTPAMSQAMCALVPQADCHIIEGAKHMLSMTHGKSVQDTLISCFGEKPHA